MDQPEFDDPRWLKSPQDLFFAKPPMWVIWNHGNGKRVIGRLNRHILRTDDVEAVIPDSGPTKVVTHGT